MPESGEMLGKKMAQEQLPDKSIIELLATSLVGLNLPEAAIQDIIEKFMSAISDSDNKTKTLRDFLDLFEKQD